MRYFLTVVLASFIFISCGGKKDSGYHLPPKVMQKLLLDVNIAEAYSLIVKDSVRRAPGKNTDSLAAYYKDIFAHYNITAEEFSENLVWYKNHPEQIDTIYTAIMPVIASWQSRNLVRQLYPKLVVPYCEQPHATSFPDPASLDVIYFLNGKDSLAGK